MWLSCPQFGKCFAVSGGSWELREKATAGPKDSTFSGAWRHGSHLGHFTAASAFLLSLSCSLFLVEETHLWGSCHSSGTSTTAFGPVLPWPCAPCRRVAPPCVCLILVATVDAPARHRCQGWTESECFQAAAPKYQVQPASPLLLGRLRRA